MSTNKKEYYIGSRQLETWEAIFCPMHCCQWIVRPKPWVSCLCVIWTEERECPDCLNNALNVDPNLAKNELEESFMETSNIKHQIEIEQLANPNNNNNNNNNSNNSNSNVDWNNINNNLTINGNGHIYSLCISEDSNTIISGSNNNDLILYSIQDGSCLRSLTGHGKGISSICVKGDNIITGSEDLRIGIWSLKDGNLKQTLIGHTGAINDCIICPNDDDIILSCSFDSTVKKWSMKEGKLLMSIVADPYSAIFAICLCKNIIITGATDISMWSIDDGTFIRSCKGHNGAIMSICCTQSNETFITGSADNSIKVWNIRNGSLVRTMYGHTDVIYKVFITPSGNEIISCSRDKTIKIWSLWSLKKDNGLINTLTGHSDWVKSLYVKENMIISGSFDGAIKIWS